MKSFLRNRMIVSCLVALFAFAGYGFLVFAAAPSGGYYPGQDLDPDCEPGDPDCLVNIIEIERSSGAPSSTPTGSDAIVYVDQDNGDVYSWDGSAWNLLGGGGATDPAGDDTEVQFNDGGVFGAESSFIFDKTTTTLSVLGSNALFTISEPVFNGSGLDDMSNSGIYTGPTPKTYTVSIDSVNNVEAYNLGITTLHNFNGTGGSGPDETFTQASDGIFYGTTETGGSGGHGVIFSYDPVAQVFTKLHDFDLTNGKRPHASLLQADDGLLYGTTEQGGAGGHGVIFTYNIQTDTFTNIHDFDSTNGRMGHAGLTMGTDGLIYGTTFRGGTSGGGVIFSYDYNTDTFTKLYDLGGTDGADIYSSLTEVSPGEFYGTTAAGGTSGVGVIFSYNTNTSTFTKLHDFAGAGGHGPHASLTLGPDGLLYGGTQYGGSAGMGVLFSFDTDTNTYTKLLDFTGTVNGNGVVGSLTLGDDNIFYGTTHLGGVHGSGVVFSYDSATNTYTKLHDFNNENGYSPYAKLIQADDGLWYGSTFLGGATNQGTIFTFDPADSILTDADTFSWTDGTITRTNIAIRGTDQTLAQGVKVLFDATEGHTLNDEWEFETIPYEQEGDIVLGGQAKFYSPDGSGFYSGFKSGVNASNIVWALPTIDGDTGTFMMTDGAGELTWTNGLAWDADTLSLDLGEIGDLGTISFDTADDMLVFTADNGYNFSSPNFTIDAVDYVWPNAQAGGIDYVLTNDGSGNLAWQDGALIVSDENLKSNIVDLPTNILDTLLNVRTVTYTLDSDSTDTTKIGFLAQDLEGLFPELVSTREDGYKGVYYAHMTPVLVEAIRELDLKIDDIENFATVENKTFVEKLIAWLGDATNGITKIFAGSVETAKVQTDELCVKTICVTENQLEQLLQNSGIIIDEPAEPDQDVPPVDEPEGDEIPDDVPEEIVPDETPDEETVPDEPIVDEPPVDDVPINPELE